MIPFWLLGLGGKFLSWLPTLLTALLESLVKPATWLLLGLIGFGGYVYGGNAEKAVCARAMQTSVDAARAIDQAAAVAARAAAEGQRAASEHRLAEAEKRIEDYARELATRPDAGCSLGDADIRALDGLSDLVVPSRPPNPPRSGGRHPGGHGVR